VVAAALLLGAACVPPAEIDELGKLCDVGRTCTAPYTCVMGRCALVTGHPVLPPSLTSNPSFESNLDGWSAYQATDERVMLSSAPDGAWVTQVSWVSGSFYSLDDAPQTVPHPTIGATYYAAACVAAASPSARGKQTEIILRAYDASDNILLKGQSPDVLLTDSFQLAEAQLTAPPNTDNVDVYVVQYEAQAGDAFYVDAVLVTTTPLPVLSCAPGASR
jgi:hypothetical protein